MRLTSDLLISTENSYSEITVLLVKVHGEYSLSRKASMWMLAFSLFYIVLLVSTFSFEQSYTGQVNAIQQNNSRVRNLNTGKTYSVIQEAINAPETLDGHEIFVASGTYYEHVNVTKSLSLIGEGQSTTIIDGNGKGKVVYVAADNVEVRNFTIQNGPFGLWLENSSNLKIIGNTLQDGSYGIRLYHSRNSELIGNDISEYTKFGVEIEESGNSTLHDNTIFENKYNFGVNGNSLFDFINDIDDSNTVNGKPIHYLINQHNTTIDAYTFKETGYLGLVNSNNIELKNLNVQDNKQGILFAFTTDSSISSVNAKNNWDGIYVAHSSNISVTGNNANSNFDYGIKFFNSSCSIASRNNVDNNGWAGIGLFKSPNSKVDENEANFNTYNLHIVYTNNSVIARNNALAIKPNGYSIAAYYSHNNVVYHNNFANSRVHIETKNGTPFTPRNSWDNGVEGNYWSLYRGIDADQDGIGDTPHGLRVHNIDNYPLMGKFYGFTVTLGKKDYGVTVISNSTISQFQFSPNDRRISFRATGEKGTIGFSRIAVQNTLLQNFPNGNLSFLINGKQPVMRRKWTNETRTYFYFSYMNRASESAIGLWITLALTSAFLIEFVLIFLVLKKKL
jgi:parallel beta-helix repeat protein